MNIPHVYHELPEHKAAISLSVELIQQSHPGVDLDAKEPVQIDRFTSEFELSFSQVNLSALEWEKRASRCFQENGEPQQTASYIRLREHPFFSQQRTFFCGFALVLFRVLGECFLGINVEAQQP